MTIWCRFARKRTGIIAPYRRNMTAAQVEQLHKQYIHKRLLERCGVPRLSLFYMH